MMKKLTFNFEFILFVALLFFSLLLAFGKGYSQAVDNGIKLWAGCVLPSLFPYFFITASLSALKITGSISNKLSPLMHAVFNQSGYSGYAFFTSVVSGYPVGAKTVADLKKQGLLTDTDAIRASALCSTSSPMFLISSVGVIMFNSQAFGLKLFAVHLLSATLTGVIFSFYKRKEKPQRTNAFIHKQSVDNLLYESAYSAVISVLIVGGLITIFYLLTEILYGIGAFNYPLKALERITKDENLAKAIVFGSFECTKGLKALSLAENGFLTLPLCALICGFGGLSVIAQSVAYLKSAKIKTATFILAKIIMAVISFLVALIFNLIL